MCLLAHAAIGSAICRQALVLHDLKLAWRFAIKLNDKETWLQLAAQALHLMDTGMAVASYRQAGDASMVLALEKVAHIEDRNLLAGHILVLLGVDYNGAQVCIQTRVHKPRFICFIEKQRPKYG